MMNLIDDMHTPEHNTQLALDNNHTVPFMEKVGYALGDGAANIAWRGVATFLFIFYTDVFGLSPATVGILFLTARFSDGISDVIMGIIGDNTQSKYGKFRSWILWTAIPLGVILALLFTTPDFGTTGKIIYAYITYFVFTLIYTANNIPYGALMGVMTGDDKERTKIGSFRMTGAFAGGMLVQVTLLFLVAYFGNPQPTLNINKTGELSHTVQVTATQDVDHADISTSDGIATLYMVDQADSKAQQPLDGQAKRQNFSMIQGETYTFAVNGVESLDNSDLTIIDQQQGYSKSMYLMSLLLAILMLITFATTKERIQPPKDQNRDLKKDFKQLLRNRPWVILLIIGLLFNIYNAIKQGILIIYFTHYIGDAILSATYLFGLGVASIVGALLTAPLSRIMGKRNLFIAALLFSGLFNALIFLCDPSQINAIFILGIISEFGSAILPTLFFVMLGDIADYSEWKNGRRATGLIYSAGSFATKFGGGIAGAIIGFVLGAYHYEGNSIEAIQGALPAIKMLMSWIPSLVTIIAAILMLLYPLNRQKMTLLTKELQARRLNSTSQ